MTRIARGRDLILALPPNTSLGGAQMSAPALFSSPAFAQRRLEARVRWAMVTRGIIAPFIVGALAWPWLTHVGALWMVTFPVMAILLATWFRRAKMND